MPFPLEEKYLLAAEEKLGARLPESYRRALMAQNGGELALGDDDWQLYPVLDASDRKRIARTANDIVRETGVARGWNRFPEHALAIGDNGAGDRLVLLREGDRYTDAVYSWSHETGELDRVADDFSELARASR